MSTLNLRVPVLPTELRRVHHLTSRLKANRHRPHQFLTHLTLPLVLRTVLMLMMAKRLSGAFPFMSIAYQNCHTNDLIIGWANLSLGLMRTSFVTSGTTWAKLSVLRWSVTSFLGKLPLQPLSNYFNSDWTISRNAGYCFVDFGSPASAAKALTLNSTLMPNSTRPFKLNWASGGGLADRRYAFSLHLLGILQGLISTLGMTVDLNSRSLLATWDLKLMNMS